MSEVIDLAKRRAMIIKEGKVYAPSDYVSPFEERQASLKRLIELMNNLPDKES